MNLLEGEDPVYSINTGVGALKTVSRPPDLLEVHQLRLLRSHAVGAGDEVPPQISRAVLAVRGNQIAAAAARLPTSFSDRPLAEDLDTATDLVLSDVLQ